jgi:LmbE family N-acetylglucosaminyl deacetylase
MNILVLSAHTDDCELGVGGTIDRFKKEGHDITVLCFSYIDDEELKNEFESAMKVLNVNRTILKDYPVREFHNWRQHILDNIISIKKLRKYDIIFTHNLTDSHRDHKIIAEESIRAFKNDASIFAYSIPWNMPSGNNNNFYIKLTREHIDNKLKSLDCYLSQKEKDYFDPEFITGLARVNGVICKSTYAESFNLISHII